MPKCGQVPWLFPGFLGEIECAIYDNIHVTKCAEDKGTYESADSTPSAGCTIGEGEP